MQQKNQDGSLWSQAEKRPNYAIRKLTIGAASILLGVTFLGVNAHQVSADETSPAVAQSSQSQADEEQSKTESAAAQSDEDSGNAIVNDQNNTAKSDKRVDNSDNPITNVKGDGTVGYDVTVTVKDKSSGKTETAEMGEDLRHSNKASLNPDNQEIAAHLKLSNHGSSALTIGSSANHKNDDGANLFINAWNNSDHTLKVSSDQAATIIVTDSTGKVVDNSMLKAYYNIGNLWETWDEITDKTLIAQARKIGIKGTLGVGLTADLNVPLVYDAKAAASQYGPNNEISVQTATYNKAAILLTTNEEQKIWSKDEIKNDYLHPVFRGDDGNYYEIPDESEISALLPRAGEVVTITNSGSIFDTSKNTLYRGGDYQIALGQIQNILRQHGYSVNIVRDGSNLMSVYSYNTNALPQNVKTADGSQDATDPQSYAYFYLEVHKILNTKDQTFQQGSAAAANWDVSQNVDSVYDQVYNADSYNGFTIKNVAGDKTKVKLVSIKDADGHLLSAINGQTPAGTYYVTVSYQLNGSNKAEMLITNTAKVVITPQAVTPPVNPGQNTAAPTQPTQPTSPTAPVSPTTPTNPGQSSNIQPHGEQVNNQENKQKERTKNGTPAPELTKAGKNVKTVMNLGPKAVASANEGRTKTAGLTNLAAKGAQAKLPQTGAKENSLAVLGFAIAAAAALFGFALDKRKQN